VRLDRPATLEDLARAAGGRVLGDGSTAVRGIASLENAHGDEMSFARSAGMRKEALSSRACALLVPEGFGDLDRPAIVAPDADVALALIGEFLLERMQPAPPTGVHEDAVISGDVFVGENASIGPCAVVEDGVSIGAHSRLGAGVYLGRGVTVGEDTVIHPNVSVYWGCRIGSRCTIHSGAVIGADGFGFAVMPDGSYRKIPQLGNVVVEDDVEVGACTCIDRAMLESTVIGRGVKLDNLIQVAHNCVIGPGTAVAAQAGMAGSTRIGSMTQIGGQVGIVGHLVVGDRCRLAAASKVLGNVDSGAEVWGYPAREKSKALREMAALSRIGEMQRDLRRLRKRLDEIEGRHVGGGGQ